MELGVYTFAELSPDPATGRAVDAGRRLRDLVEELVLADEVGLEVLRAALLGLPLAVAIIGGSPSRFVPLVDLSRDTARDAGHDPATLPVGINSHACVADSTQRAADECFPAYAAMMTRIGRERGWPPMTRPQFDQLHSPARRRRLSAWALRLNSRPGPSWAAGHVLRYRACPSARSFSSPASSAPFCPRARSRRPPPRSPATTATPSR